MQRNILLPDDIREQIDEGTVFNINIGIHTGSAVGGIIVDERFVFDLHGDDVNLAARMESSGEPGRIHVRSEFAMHLQNRMNMVGTQPVASVQPLSFKLTKRGEIEIKGKGMMRTYYLENQ